MSRVNVAVQTPTVFMDLIKARLGEGISRALPFRFITAARYAPALEPDIETAMLKSIEGMGKLSGKTGILVDVSGSMGAALSIKSDTTRMDAAFGLAILLREIAEHVVFATFSSRTMVVPPRRGFALRDALNSSQPHSSTQLSTAMVSLKQAKPETGWSDIDRLIVITDEQSQDGSGVPFAQNNYVINVAPYKNGVGYKNGWTHIDGWSERVVDYIQASEEQA